MKLAISFVLLVQLCSQLLADPVPEPQRRPQCTDSDLTITVDNKLAELHIDGVQVSSGLANANKWNAADTVRVPASAHVIAVKAENAGYLVAGLLASGPFSTTDGSWKCTKEFHDGWATKGFDDSAWPAATVIGSNGVFPWKTVSGISADAEWIWTERHGLFADKTVYCRKKRDCAHGTGPTCITSCHGRPNGDYQSCKRCNVYASCSNGIFYDERPCPAGLVWDDSARVKRCEWKSPTCSA